LQSEVELGFCSLALDETLPAIVVVWNGYATTEQLRAVHARLLEMISAYHVTKILADDTALPTVAAADQRWINDHWMPRAVSCGLRAVATKRATGYFGQVAIESIPAGAPKSLEISTFETISAARQWLAPR
jgi:hypothetical protein